MHRGGVGHDHLAHIELAPEGRGEQRAGAAEGMQHEVARIEAALDRNLVDQIGDLRRRDAIDAEGRGLDRAAERARDLLVEHAARRLEVELDRAIEKMVGIHVADQGHDIGERRLAAAPAIAHRPRARARASRADPRHFGFGIERHDRAAARADRDHLDLGRGIVIAIDQRLARIVERAALDDADLERGAAHVAGDDVGIAHQSAEIARTDHAGRGTALDHADRAVRRLVRRQQAAIALHHHDRATVAGGAELGLEALQIVAADRAGIGVDHGGRGALILARHRRDFARERDIDAGRDSLDQRAQLPLVNRIVERPEERDRERLDPPLLNQKSYGGFGGRFLQFTKHRPLIIDSLRHALDCRRIDQRRCAIGFHRVLDPILRQAAPATIGTARDEQRILEALGGEKPGARA